MRVFLTVQGEGRGHLTQAIAVSRILSQRGDELVGVVVGRTGLRELPEYFRSAVRVPVIELPSPGFVLRDNRALSLPGTIGQALLSLGETRRSVRALREAIERARPDLVLNFFEPLTGLAQLRRPLPAAVVSIAHQFLFLHPEYVWPKGLGLEAVGLRAFTRLVGARSFKLGLSLVEGPDREGERLTVGPPLLREGLFSTAPQDAGFYLAYLLNHGYADEVRTWQAKHPEVVMHCFVDRPGAPDTEVVSPGLTFHRLNGDKFLMMMARCRAVVTTAGFETVAEAAWLGKPVFMVPVEGHLEQHLNAIEGQRLGLGLADRRFALDRLGELPPPAVRPAFQAWVGQAEGKLNHVVRLALAERVAARPRRRAARLIPKENTANRFVSSRRGSP